MRFVIALLFSLLFFAAPSRAQSRNVTGCYLGDPGPVTVSQLVGPQEAENLSPSLPFTFPRWDGRDDAGNPVPWSKLRGVQITIRHRLNVVGAGENLGPATGLWQAETGTRSYFARASDPTDEWGGGSFVSYVAASEGLAAYDGTVDGQGASGWTEPSTGTPFVWEYLDVGANRDDLRKWCGGGYVTVLWKPRAATISHGFGSHWRQWSTASVEVLDVQPGAQIAVRYVLGDAPIAGAFRVERGPWVDYGMIRDLDEARLIGIPAGEGDPSKFLGAYLEHASESGKWLGIENQAPFTATCGGSSSGGVRILRAGQSLTNLYSNSNTGVGSFAPVSAYDGTTDWHGWSGRETFQGAYVTDMLRTLDFSPSWAGEVTLVAQVGHAVLAPQSITPGATFAWDGKWRFSGRVRVVRIYATH